MQILEKDKMYMQRCFQLAKLGNSNVFPNPMVGAVLVYNNTIIGEGFHEHFGGNHAEVNCIQSVKEIDKKYIKDAVLYCSLEPCNHIGKTPACTQLIIKNNIKKVVISVTDTNPIVCGAGIDFLRKNGIEVITNILENEGKYLLRKFLYYHTQKKPFITLKWAESCDGFIGKNNEQIWLSNDLTKRFTHKLRAENHAIIVGKNTFLIDNPKLDVRFWFGKNPIIITAHLQTKKNIFELVQFLYEQNIQSILVEGGSIFLQSFIDANLWNEAFIYKTKKELKDGIKAPIFTVKYTSNFALQDNLIFNYTNEI